MNGNQDINITLNTDQWRDVYRILNRDRTNSDAKNPKVNEVWHSHLQAIEDVCKVKQQIVTIPLAMTWPMAATVRVHNSELADEISRQMNAQLQERDDA